MKQPKVKLSAEFKTHATKAILAITFFVVTYCIILLLALALAGLCILAGGLIIAAKVMFITLMLGIGLASLGVLVLIFLLKFIFKSHQSDRSHLVEISQADEPALFQMIDEIVREVKTSFPKKVYLSTDVNAAVFYDSSFWSMFLPVEKNLQIGIGLVNTVSSEELKAILSHEFGHFSQRTMKVGSMVYNLNQVIFNMLYDNESYEKLIIKWASVSGYFSIFVAGAVKINAGIQWILRRLYEVVNINYMGLSREMEFHADAIAASVTGYEPLKSALLRMSLADNSFGEAINFYNGKIADNLKSENIYRDQAAVLQFLAEVNNFPVINELPEVSLEEQSKFDKSRLVIKDQWASHPTVKERIQRLESTGFTAQHPAPTLANQVFKNITQTQERLTSKLFEAVEYGQEAQFISFDNFRREYQSSIHSNAFSKIYNGYYDNKGIAPSSADPVQLTDASLDVKDLFSDAKVDLVYTANALQNDRDTLKNIASNTLQVKTFDYDGVRYKRKDADRLLERLDRELEELNGQITANDRQIYAWFKKAEQDQSLLPRLESLYQAYFAYEKELNDRYEFYTAFMNDLQFVHVTTPFDQIRTNLASLLPREQFLKSAITQQLSDPVIQGDITREIRENLEMYTSQTWEYFTGSTYEDQNLGMLSRALHNYAYLLYRKHFLMKKNLLAYQEKLIGAVE